MLDLADLSAAHLPLSPLMQDRGVPVVHVIRTDHQAEPVRIAEGDYRLTGYQVQIREANREPRI
jgi:hypothetical protein